MTAKQMNEFLQYVRIRIFEEFTDGSDADWDRATDVAVEIGVELGNVLNLPMEIQKG